MREEMARQKELEQEMSNDLEAFFESPEKVKSFDLNLTARPPVKNITAGKGRKKMIAATMQETVTQLAEKVTEAKGPKAIEVTKKYKYFDLVTFEEKVEEAKVTFVPSTDYVEALGRIGNDTDIALKALNAYLQRAAFNEARKEIALKGGSKKVVFDIIRPLRNLPPWSEIEDRKEQTKSLLGIIKQNEMMVAGIKAATLKALEVETEDDDGEDDE